CEPFDHAVDGCGDGRFHLHRLDGCDRFTGANGRSDIDLQRDHTGERRCHLTWFGRVCLLDLVRVDGNRAIPYEHWAQLTVQRGHDSTHSAIIRLTDRLKTDVELHAAVDLHQVFLALHEP